MHREIRIGPAGWSYGDWNGVVYPTNRDAGFHEAEYLARYFSVIEINLSFYRPLRPEVSRVWARKLARHEQFRFTAKLYRGFTHEGKLDRDSVHAYCAGLEPLIDAGKLGCVLMQFPWSFRLTKENLNRVLWLGRTFSQYPLVAEMRHASWNSASALGAFADHGIGFCNMDQPRLNQCLPPTAHVTSSVGYVRFHGRNYEQWFQFDDSRTPRPGMRAVEVRYDYLYTPEQLRKWKSRLERIAGQAETTYVITNNHFQGKSVVNAIEILALLSGEPVEAPETLLERYPELYGSVRNLPPQRSLFFERRRRDPHPHGLPPRRAAAAYARA